MRKRKLRFFICGIIQLSVSVFFFFAAAFVSGNLKNYTPSAIELYDTKGLNISVAQASSFVGQGNFAAAGTGENISVTDTGENKMVSVYYQETTSNYGEYAKLHFCEGEYFSAVVSEENVVVIPESLLKELFQEKNEGKKRLYINGEEFTVCGVYEDGDVLTQLGSADIPVIYGKIPENSETLAEHLLIKAEEGKTAGQQQQEMAAMMKIPLEGEVNDLEWLHQLGDSILLLGVFFAGLWFVLYLCVFSYKKLMSVYENKENAVQRRLNIIFAVGIFLFAVIGFALLLQLVQIPAIYLPENNIFDVSYYGKEILNGIQQINTDGRVKDFSRICAVYLGAETMLVVVAVPLFWAGCQKLRKGLKVL
ncbi:MAG: ABC transporter permease [Blautia sp.]|nr:ABC transporter permease [Blautia sp.]